MKFKLFFIFIFFFFLASIVCASSYKEYKIGDTVSYKGIDFYVIQNSDENSDSVTLLKAEPLSLDEVNTYGVGHVNVYTSNSQGTAYNSNGYGGMAHYTSSTCGYVDGSYVETGCTTDYDKSEIKYVVDAWAADKLVASDLKEDSTGYSARLITYDELLDNLGYENSVKCTGGCYYTGSKDNVPIWVYNSDYSYWTMSQNGDTASYVWYVDIFGDLRNYSVDCDRGVVRPVITLRKSAVDGILDYSEDNAVDLTNKKLNNSNKETEDVSNKVSVPNTLKKIGFFSIVIGFVLVLISIIIFIKKKIARGK